MGEKIVNDYISGAGDGENVSLVSLSWDRANEKFDVLEIMGELDSYSLDLVKDEIWEEVKKIEKKALIVNLEKLRFLNSKSIGYLFELNEYLKKKNQKLVLVGSKNPVKDVLLAVGVFEMIEHHDLLSEAVSRI